MPEKKQIKAGEATLDLIIDKDGRHTVQYKGVKYRVLLDLMKACPELFKDNFELPLARVVTHLYFGDKLRLIDDSDAYIDKYWKKLKEVAANPKILPPELANMWLVPLSVFQIIDPYVDDNFKLICYVEDLKTGLPFIFKMKLPVETPVPDFTIKTLEPESGFFTWEKP